MRLHFWNVSWRQIIIGRGAETVFFREDEIRNNRFKFTDLGLNRTTKYTHFVLILIIGTFFCRSNIPYFLIVAT